MKSSIHNLFKRTFVFLTALCVFLLPGCASDAPAAEPDSTTTKATEQTVTELTSGPISDLRTGIVRQGISGQFKSYECTEDRVYFMVNVSGSPMLYWSAHDSTDLRPLCAKTGCDHSGSGCDAYFAVNGNVCAYQGFLYVDAGTALYRLNPDGTGREKILDIRDAVAGDYDGIAEPLLWNGIFTFYMTKYESVGDPLDNMFEQVRYDPYYFRLDGSMEKPEPMASLIAQYNDGTNFILRGPAEKEDLKYENSELTGTIQTRILYTWNPETNDTEQIADCFEIMSQYYVNQYLPEEDLPYNMPVMRPYEAFDDGYWGAEYAYFLQPKEENEKVVDNSLCKLNYQDGSVETLKTFGLAGSYRLCCFPDCIILCQTVDYNAANRTVSLKLPTLYFFDWACNPIGQCQYQDEIGISPEDVICGESESRIYLAAHYLGVPEYYIEKTELNGGSVELHPLSYDGIDPAAAYEQLMSIMKPTN